MTISSFRSGSNSSVPINPSLLASMSENQVGGVSRFWSIPRLSKASFKSIFKSPLVSIALKFNAVYRKKNVIKWARPKALLSIRDNVAYFKTQFILIRSISSWSVSACGTFTCTTGTSVSFAACTCTTGTSFSAAATFSIPCHHGKEYQSQNRLHLQKRKKKKWSTVFQKQSETNDCLG